MKPFLRDGISNRRHWQKNIRELRAEPTSAFVLGRLGDLLRCDAGSVEESVRVLKKAVGAARKEGEKRLAAANMIRLGTALQYSGRHRQALVVFDEAIRLITRMKLKNLKDFAYQHKGKVLVEMGRVDEGISYFRKALQMRKRRGQMSLVRSSKAALMEAEYRDVDNHQQRRFSVKPS